MQGCEIDPYPFVCTVVGHSRGSLISSYYICTRPIPATLTHWVNANGRWVAFLSSIEPMTTPPTARCES